MLLEVLEKEDLMVKMAPNRLGIKMEEHIMMEADQTTKMKFIILERRKWSYMDAIGYY